MLESVINQKVSYGWNRETVLSTTIPFLSNYVERVQTAFLREPIVFETEPLASHFFNTAVKRATEVKRFAHSHYLGYVVQLVGSIALAILLHPSFLAISLTSTIGCLSVIYKAVNLLGMRPSEDWRVFTPSI